MTKTQQKGYIFLCSNSTEDECLQKMLLGGTKGYRLITGKIEPGSILFLYNYHSGRLHGKFKATSEGQFNISPEAWEGKYPWQVKVSWIKEYEPISKVDFQHVFNFRDYPPVILSEQQLTQIEKIFESDARLPHLENEFRNKFLPLYRASDGHEVRSKSEIMIDNWLFNQDITHSYEKRIPIEEELYSDFSIRDSNTKESIYMEFWGLTTKEYLEKKLLKLKLYKKYNLKLIELNPGDIKALDDILPRKLRPYLKDHKFN